MLKEILPKEGELYTEIKPSLVLCKPKVLPLKSVTLEKLERMQRELQEAVRAQQAAAVHTERADEAASPE